MATSISHANIRVADLARSINFYEVLGLEVLGAALLGPRYYTVYCGNPSRRDVSIELVVNDAAPPDYDRSPGSGHIAVIVEDLDETLANLSASGFEVESPPTVPGGREGFPRVAFVRDPDRTRVEVIDRSFPTPSDSLEETVRRAGEGQ